MSKSDWKVKKLGEICNILNGYAFDSKFFTNNSSATPLIRIRDVKRGYTETFYTGEYDESYIVREGDYIIGMDGEFNIGKWKSTNALLNQRVCKIWANDTKTTNNRYVYYFLSSLLKKIEEKTAFVTVKHLSSKQLNSSDISIPSFPTQQQIVKELDTLSDIIAKKKEQLTELDKLAQATFYDMFGDPVENEKGWDVRKINEFSSVKIGPFGSALHAEDYINNGIPLVNPSHMHRGKIIHDSKMTISEKKSNELVSYFLKKGDIVIGRRGEIGRCAIVTKDEEGFICGTGSLFIRFIEDINPLYFYFTFTSSSLIKLLINEAKGATMLNINSKIISNVNIPLPPLALQNQFAKKIEAIEQQKALINQSITDTQLLFDCTMDKYFN